MIHVYKILLLAVCLQAAACFKEDEYKKSDPDKIIRFVTADPAVVADGVSTALLQIQLSEDAAPDKMTVVFKTTSGTFVGGAGDSLVAKAGTDFIASARLAGTRPGNATVTAKILNISAAASPVVVFNRAFPDKVTASVDSFVIHTNYSSEIPISAVVSTANGGKASQGTTVYFSVTDAGGLPVGSFLNNQTSTSSGADGKASIRYSAGPNVTPGFLTIKDSVQKADGTYINATTRIYLSN